MKQQEQFNQTEATKETEVLNAPVFDSTKNWNGMYANEEEFAQAEAVYKIDINTISLEEQTTYPIKTLESQNDSWQSEGVEYNSPSIEVETELVSEESTQENKDVIDVEAKVIKTEDLKENDNLSELIDEQDELEIEGERLKLTPKLKSLAKGVLSALDHLLSGNKAELPEVVDWRPYIMSEPGYDESYDYIILHRILNAEYRRRRSRMFGPNLADIMAADILNNTPPPLTTPEGSTRADNEGAPQESAAKEKNEDGILKIEMDQPTEEVPKLEYERSEVPTLTYDEEVRHEKQNAPKQITQQ